MNLQVSIPKKEPCVNKCPFCVVKTHERFNKESLPLAEWVRELDLFLQDNNKLIDRIVITGENEPVQQLDYVIAAIATAKNHGKTVEFITTGVGFFDALNNNEFKTVLKFVDVLSISTLGSMSLNHLFISRRVPDYRALIDLFRSINHMGIVRLTVLETRMFTTKHLDKLIETTHGLVEITLKKLQGSDANIWIYNHDGDYVTNYLLTNKAFRKKKRGAFMVVLYKNNEVWVDLNCQEAEGRYYIFRGDGKIYNDWGDR